MGVWTNALLLQFALKRKIAIKCSFKLSGIHTIHVEISQN